MFGTDGGSAGSETLAGHAVVTVTRRQMTAGQFQAALFVDDSPPIKGTITLH
jgi:hypothetical protein